MVAGEGPSAIEELRLADEINDRELEALGLRGHSVFKTSSTSQNAAVPSCPGRVQVSAIRFIISGKRLRRRQLGFGADFCPLCRSIQQFRIMRIGLVGHVYFISIGQGERVGTEGICLRCGVPRARDEEANLETNPQLPERLDPAERSALLEEPFRLVGEIMDARLGRGRDFDRPAGLGCLTTLALLAVLFGVAIFAENSGSLGAWLGPAILIVGGGGLVWTLVALATVHSRFRKRRVLPALADCLRPLRPSERELEVVIESLRATGLSFGRGLEACHVCAAIRERRLRGD